MYNLPYFKSGNPEEVIRFMQEHPFVFLSGADAAGKPVATQVPVFIDEREGRIFLSGHLMKNTDHHRAFEQNPEVLAVFTGPHCYVSASWYTNPHMGSTWNYMSVHARGRIRFGEGEAIVQALQRLTLHYEKGNTASPTFFDNLPAEYTAKMMQGILAFEIEVTELDHVFKLSQNRDEKSYDNIIVQLKQQDGDGPKIAALMEQRRTQLFSK